MVALLLALGCSAPRDTPLRVTRGPLVALPANADVHLARVVELSTNQPTRLELDWGDGRAQWTEWSTEHRVPILGLHADRAYELTAHVYDTHGRSREVSARFETEPLAVALPEMHVLVHDVDAMEPGFTLIGFHFVKGGPTILVAYDADLEPVWVFDSADALSDLQVNARGTLYALQDGRGVELNFLGEYQRRWTAEPEFDYDILWEGGRLNYDFLPIDEGFASITFEPVEVDAFPIDYDTPEVLDGPTLIRTPNIVKMGEDGQQLDKWPLYERLDSTRIGFNSLNWHSGTESWDWAHSNAVTQAPDGFVVSLRHQDAVIKLDQKGDLVWILGNHDGWSAGFERYLLEPIGDLQWPFHQHGPMVSSDGQVVLFDNHNNGYSPYDVPDELPENISRIAAFRVDEVAMTVEQTLSYSETIAGTIYSPVMGDADWQPTTGNVLAIFASTTQEAGVGNPDNGWGKNAIRLIEVDPTTAEVALDLRFTSDFAVNEDGWWSPRAERFPGFYPQ